MTARSPAAADRPPALTDLDPDRISDLDVREMLRSGGEPFERIMAAAAALPPDGVLRLRAIFEPRPLYGVMASRGFEHWTEQLGPEDWRVWFWRPDAGATDDGRASGRQDGGGRPLPIERTVNDSSEETDMSAKHGPYLLDVRKLDGPDKHPTIHRMFDALEPGQALTIVNDHQPKPLFYELQAERPDRFDAENYRAYEAADRVWVAVIPTVPEPPAA